MLVCPTGARVARRDAIDHHLRRASGTTRCRRELAVQLTQHPTGVGLWRIAPDLKRICFTAPDTVHPDEKARLDKRFDVRIRNAMTPLYSLWAFEIGTSQVTRLTRDTTYSVGDLSLSPDDQWIGCHGLSTSRFERNILEQNEPVGRPPHRAR